MNLLQNLVILKGNSGINPYHTIIYRKALLMFLCLSIFALLKDVYVNLFSSAPNHTIFQLESNFKWSYCMYVHFE